MSLRPEALRLLALGEAAPAGWTTLAGTLGEIEYLGPVTRFTVQLGDGALIHLMALAPPAASGAVTLAYDPQRVVVMGAGT
jgi:TOBE domain